MIDLYFENKRDIENDGKNFQDHLYSILDSFLLISCSVAGLVMV